MGIDPGTTVGYCALDLDGSIIKISSKKELSKDMLVKLLSNLGKVLIVACDRKRVPDFVKSVSIALGAVLYTPGEDLLVSEKIRTTKKIRYNNSHQRDAAASAMFAYLNYKPKLKDIDQFLDSKDKNNLSERFIDKAIKNININYHHILEQFEEENNKQQKIRKNPIQKIIHYARSDDRLKSNNLNLLKKALEKNEALLRQNLELKNQVKSLAKAGRQKSLRHHPKKRSEQELMKIIFHKEKRFQSILQQLKKTEKEMILERKKVKAILHYSTNKDEFLFISFYDSLTKINPKIINDRIIFISNVNVYTDKSIELLNIHFPIIISLQKITNKLNKKLDCIVLEWKGLFFEKIIDKVVIRSSDFKGKLSKNKTFEQALTEYKEKRKQELSE